jgi:hypothetical protein
MSTWLKAHQATLLALVGVVVTWAVTYFPNNHTVELVAALVAAILTVFGVHLATPGQAKAQALRKAA